MDIREQCLEASEWMYQNIEEQSFQWLSEHLDKIKEAMILAWQEKYLGNEQAKEILVEILRKLVEAYNRQDILEMADTIRYEIAEYIG